MKARLSLLKTIMLGSLAFSFSTNAEVKTPVLEAFAKHSQYLQIKISPDGKYLASTSRDDEGVVFLTVLDIEKQKVQSITRGRGKESVGSFNWLNDERLLLSMVREVGSLEQPVPTGELLAMDADGSDNVVLTGYRSKSGDTRYSQVVDFLPDDPDAIVVFSVQGSTKEPFLDLYKMKVSNGRKASLGRMPLRMYKSTGDSLRIITNSKGEALAMTSSDPNENNQVTLMVRSSVNDDWQVAFQAESFDSFFNPLVFLADDKTLVGLSTIETDTDAVATYNIDTKKHTVLAAHEMVDVEPILHEVRGQVQEVIGAEYEYKDLSATYFSEVKNTDEQRILASLRQAFKGSVVSITSSTYDGSKMIVAVGGINQPTAYYLFNKNKKQLAKLTDTRPWLNDFDMPQSKVVTYKARDGQEISGILTLPVGVSKNLPLIMHPHGGPHGLKDTLTEMRSDAKVLAAHGYAVFQPNFRGSGGYGLEFLKAGFKSWGTLMIDDMTDGVNYLIEQGIVDQNRMCVYGASYGGYAALQSVIREPDLYKCTVGFVGVYDLALMKSAGDIPESQSGINYLNRVLPDGDSQSPVKNVDKIKVPVFIIQGEEDVRVPKEHAFALREELEKRNKPYEWMMKSGEAHGFYKEENNVERWTAMIEFFDKHTAKQLD